MVEQKNGEKEYKIDEIHVKSWNQSHKERIKFNEKLKVLKSGGAK